MIEDGSFSYVKPTEGDRAEVDGPDIVGDLLEANVFAAEQMRDVDPGGVPSDAAVGGDLTGNLRLQTVSAHSSAHAGGRDGGLSLEVFVHAFVAAVLLGRCGLDEIGQDAELDPPDGEPGEAP